GARKRRKRTRRHDLPENRYPRLRREFFASGTRPAQPKRNQRAVSDDHGTPFMNADVLRKAQRHLSRRDAVLQPLIRTIGPCTLKHNTDHFAILVRSIISQQISTKAAIAIGNRLLDTVKRFQPRRLLAATDGDLRAA